MEVFEGLVEVALPFKGVPYIIEQLGIALVDPQAGHEDTVLWSPVPVSPDCLRAMS